MNHIKIKKISHRDTDIINDLLARHIEVENADNPPTLLHLQNMVQDDSTFIFAAMMDENVVGYLLAYSFPSLCASSKLAYLYDIDVLPEYQRKGIGTRLMEAAKSDLKTNGVDELWLGTAVDNASAQQLFGKTGGIKTRETFYDYTFEL